MAPSANPEYVKNDSVKESRGLETLNNGTFTNGLEHIGKRMDSNDKDMDRDSSLNPTPSDSGLDECQDLIAIVGMGMRLPGDINSSEDFWDLLINKRDGRGRVPSDRYNVDAFYSPIEKPGTVRTKFGYFLKEGSLEKFDASFFSMNKSEVAKLDPQQRMLLEVAWECLENAGETEWRGQDIGCYVGVFGEDWNNISMMETQPSGNYRITGTGDFVLANRISYEYDLKGPSMTIKTGCSSALFGLHLACKAIRDGECSSAIVAGTNLIMSPTMSIAMFEQGVLTSSGSSRSFDAAADGYARGEAINVLYIKKLSAALRDGNPIRSVIRGTSTNCDGKTPGITQPSVESHERVIRQAYNAAGLSDYSQTGLFECHATGTAVGDPLEARAVANVFGNDGIIIGSVKPNMGHSEGASGLTSTIKAILALEHRTIPPQINFSKPNPKIPFQEAGLHVPVEATAWPTDRCERASINSFGIGGANVHVILDSATSLKGSLDKAPNALTSFRAQLLVFSANHAGSLQDTVSKYERYVKTHRESLHDLSYTLGARRIHLPHRTFSIATAEGLQEVHTAAKIPSAAPEIVFVFTGQGAQWPQMGMELIRDFPSFREDIRSMDEVLQSLADPPSWMIEDELLKPASSSSLDLAELSQPICTAIQVAIVKLLWAWGVYPKAVVGHSSGEIAGAFASNAITESEAIIIAYYRGKMVKNSKRNGAMAAIGMSRDKIDPYLTPGVVIACENSPRSITLSGDKECLESLLVKARAENPDVLVRPLRVDMAYHSHHMKDFGNDYESFLNPYVQSHAPTIPFYSSVTGKRVTTTGALNAPYWRQNLESTVRFYTAIRLLDTQINNKLFLEIGPHGALAGPLRQTLEEVNLQASHIPTLVRNKNGTESLLTTAGQLYQHGLEISFRGINPSGNVLTDLPTYSWNHEAEYWDESRLSKEWRLRKFPHHDLLGSRVTEGTDLQPTWRNILHLADVPWITDHKIHNDVVLPFAAYIAMAGEAVKQLTGIADYTCRNLVVNTALLLTEDNKTEIITSLRPVRLTDSLESEWYEFSIASYTGAAWVKHCSGQVISGRNIVSNLQPIDSLARKVSSPNWYRTMSKVGLNYGSAFQGLADISTSPVKKIAVADISSEIHIDQSDYQLHPITIDLALQLFSAASSSGQARDFKQICVPTAIDEVYICHAHTKVHVTVQAESDCNGPITGDAIGMAADESVLLIKGLRLSPIQGSDATTDTDPHAAVELEWRPDVDFQDPTALFDLPPTRRSLYAVLEKLTLLCILETNDLLNDLPTPVGHLGKYRNWLSAQCQRASSGEYALLEEAQELAALNRQERQKRLQAVRQELEASEAAPSALPVTRIFDFIMDIFEHKVEPLEVLLEDNVLSNFYSYSIRWYSSEYVKLLAHNNPSLRILEIGAGTGGTTSKVLPDLYSGYGERMYSKYTYTDVSAGFMNAAKERFKNHQNIDYVVLDITKDPGEQGLELGSYDLVLASNVIHATPSISSSLRNAKSLLKSGGRLILQELCPVTRLISYIMGTLPGWWLGDADGRPDEPFISPQQWDTELRNAGYSNGAETVVYEDDLPWQMLATIVASSSSNNELPKKVTILHSQPVSPAFKAIVDFMTMNEIRIDFCTLEDSPPPDQDVISLLEIESPFFDALTPEAFVKFQTFLSSLKSSGVLWVTRSAQVNCKDPRFGLSLGMARTIRTELSVDFATLELDELDKDMPTAILKVFNKFQKREKVGLNDPDFEFVRANGIICIPRFHWISMTKQLEESLRPTSVKRLEIETPGLLQTLAWTQIKERALIHDQVEVETRAIGLNFRDVLVSMGIVNSPNGAMGFEASGTIRRVGPDVTDLRVGDRVAAISGESFCTRLITSALLCVRIPDGLTFEEATTMPCVYATVIYSLIDVARLERGQTVLIHSACGGVGLAAIQVCQAIGASIYLTVGSEEKVQHLIREFGIPRERIFNSREPSFLPDVMRETNNRGVDVVLNSLSGELLHTSWKCVAEFGMMVEIGKRDFMGRAQLGMDLFQANRSFCGVDLAQFSTDRPARCRNLLDRCMAFYQLGNIKPIRPVALFDASQVQDAFRYMQKGQHIGKIVVKMPQNARDLSVRPTAWSLDLRSNASYLLIGGLGGLGRAVATYLVENGATELLFLSRSAGTSVRDKQFFLELKALGCTARAFQGSVASLTDLQGAIRQSTNPIAGVIQLSMVLRDRALLEMSHDDWRGALNPKVQGTWNLHEVLSKTNLQFFVLISSLSGMHGNWGQANYAAANTFLDSFVQFRHANGLPASVIDVGVIEDAGYVSETPSLLTQFQRWGTHTITEPAFLDSLRLAIKRSTPAPGLKDDPRFVPSGQVVIGVGSTTLLSDPNNNIIWKSDARMSLYRNLENATDSAESTSNQDLKRFVDDAMARPSILSDEQSSIFLATEIGKRIFEFMLKPEDELDIKLSLTAIGVDSLISIEIRNWWKQSMGFEISVLEVLGCGSIEELGRKAAEGLKIRAEKTAEKMAKSRIDERLIMKAP